MLRSVLALLAVGLVASCAHALRAKGTFDIAPDGSTFLKDGKPFRVLSAGFHYFRVPAAEWEIRLRTLNASGVNTLQTYVAWNYHCPKADKPCKFDGDQDLERFLSIAQKLGLYVLLRPGPYICAEWEFGGFPAWLLKKRHHPPIRTMDQEYLDAITKWYKTLMPRMKPFLYQNGGNILMVQVENEFGSVTYKDTQYLEFVRDLTWSLLGKETVLYSTDGAGEGYLEKTAVGGVYQTIDFYGGNMTKLWEIQRSQWPISRPGPPMNSEFYAGWLTYWGDGSVAHHDPKQVADIARDIMIRSANNSNMNVYMFFGGTNFGFSQGAGCLTSYDYGAPMNESGHVTEMYTLLQKAFDEVPGINRPSINPPQPPPLGDYGKVEWDTVVPFGAPSGSLVITSVGESHVKNSVPLSMEEVDQDQGYTAYTFPVPADMQQSAVNLTVDVFDYGMVYADKNYIGFLIQQVYPKKFPENRTIALPKGTKEVTIVVDNFGRANYWNYVETVTWAKGIYTPVNFTGADGHQAMATDFVMTTLPMDNATVQKAFQQSFHQGAARRVSGSSVVGDAGSNAGFFARGTFKIPSTTPSGGTMLDLRGFTKGAVYVNGFNLGRYWTPPGPQYSYYCPPSYLRFGGVNEVIIVEQQQTFGDKPSLAELTLSPNNYNKM